MGLFDFIKELGHSKDVDDAKLQQELQDSVHKAGLSIQNFQLQVADGLATISGTALTQKDLELARLIVGNHKGVNRVNDDGLNVAGYAPGHSVPSTPLVLAPNQAEVARAAAMMVTVKKGDTLSHIAKEYLGSSSLYREIFEANRPMLKDPDEIFPGQVLRIPGELNPQKPAPA